MVSKTPSTYFLMQLLKPISPALVLVAAVAAVYVYLMQFVDHDLSQVPYLIVLFAFIKTVYFTFFTFRQVNKSIGQYHSYGQLLGIFGMLVLLIIFSFAADFTCLFTANTSSFEGIKTPGYLSYPKHLLEFFYLSVVTFASVGYGEIVPATVPARLLVMMEIGQSFVMVIFGLSNINNIHTTSLKYQ